MKKFLRLISLPLIVAWCSIMPSNNAVAQCNATINWDNLQYLVNAGNYATYVTTAMQNTQRFAIGTNGLQIAAGSGVSVIGTNGSQTADAGGIDAEFQSSAGVITLTFDSEVTNLTFNIYDIDRRQAVAINGKNAANANVSTTAVRLNSGTTVLTLAPASGIGPTVTATACTSSTCDVADNSNNGTISVTIAGPVKTITLTVSNSGTVNSPELYIGDITACVSTPFPAQYYLPSKPFTGQPGYVLTVVNNNFYATRTDNGVSRFLFTEPGNTYVNSLAYDPINRFVYYTYSLTGSPSTDKTLKKYDLNTKTISTVLSNVNTIGIPTFDFGVESGSAAFYNGSLFFGIEGYADDFDKGRKSIVWRIDFNGSNVPYQASQVYSSLADDGSSDILHDWSDIGCSNGILYDFDGAQNDEDFYVFNMRTGVVTNYSPASGVVGRQVGIGWDEKIYNIDGTITQYNLTNGHTGSTSTITATPAIPGGGSWGDAGEAFRPFVDYGDAPSTYDPTIVDPAVHDSVTNTLRIGAAVNIEGAKRGITSTEDTYDDGIASVPFLPAGYGQYVATVTVFNNTGANATLAAWLDYNGNGVFNTGEGISQVVASSASTQTKYLYWPSIPNSLTNGSFTYLRVRLTSTSNGMTTANPTGYFSDGEVEDYRVRVDNYPLSVNMLTFDARVINSSNVKLNWSANEEAGFSIYDVERSSNGTDWDHFAFVDALNIAGIQNYELTDPQPYRGTSYYRIKLGSDNGVTKYSVIRTVTINNGDADVRITPNPASDKTMIYVFNPGAQTTTQIRIISMKGEQLYSQQVMLRSGENPISLPLQEKWPVGMYMVQVQTGDEITNKKLLIKR